jgi:hypothetical protein
MARQAWTRRLHRQYSRLKQFEQSEKFFQIVPLKRSDQQGHIRK